MIHTSKGFGIVDETEVDVFLEFPWFLYDAVNISNLISGSSSQFPRRLVLKNVITTGQLHSSPMLVRSCLKSCMLGFGLMQTKNFQVSKLGLEKQEEPEIKLLIFTAS